MRQHDLTLASPRACRLVKEVAFYEAEVKENEATLAQMKQDNKDPYDIKKFEEVLGESYMMIPDANARLKQSLEDLASFVESDEVATGYTENEWYAAAREVLAKEANRYDSGSKEVVETNVDDLQEGEAF